MPLKKVVHGAVGLLCVLVLAALSALGVSAWLDSRVPPLESLTLVQGRVLQPSRPCRGARHPTFDLVLYAGERYQSLTIACDERLRTAAVGGTQVVLRLQAEEAGPPRWRARMAKVDGREVVPYASDRPDLELRAFVVFTLVYLPFLFVAAAVRRGRQRARTG